MMLKETGTSYSGGEKIAVILFLTESQVQTHYDMLLLFIIERNPKVELQVSEK